MTGTAALDELLRQASLARQVGDCAALTGIDVRPDTDTAAVMEAADCRGLSLQYDPVGAGIDRLAQAVGRQIAVDASVDAVADLDGLAAQVRATDFVVTISNTTAHLVGALGHPCLVLLDDDEHPSWPRDGGTSPFYPSVRLLRKAGRDWSAVMADAVVKAQEMPGQRLDRTS